MHTYILKRSLCRSSKNEIRRAINTHRQTRAIASKWKCVSGTNRNKWKVVHILRSLLWCGFMELFSMNNGTVRMRPNVREVWLLCTPGIWTHTLRAVRETGALRNTWLSWWRAVSIRAVWECGVNRLDRYCGLRSGESVLRWHTKCQRRRYLEQQVLSRL